MKKLLVLTLCLLAPGMRVAAWSVNDLIKDGKMPVVRDGSLRLEEWLTSLEGLERIKNPETATTLDLSHNKLTSLPAGIFDKLTNLTFLYLRDNELTSLPAGIFDKLTDLRSLDLSDNKLTSLPAGIFDNLKKMEELRLERNGLKSLPDKVFLKNTKLKTLAIFKGNAFDGNTIKHLKKMPATDLEQQQKEAKIMEEKYREEERERELIEANFHN